MHEAGQKAQAKASDEIDLQAVNHQLRLQVEQLGRQLEQLRDSEVQYRLLFERAAAGFAFVDLQGKFVNVNDNLCNMLGYTREELLTKTWTSITHPSHLPANIVGSEDLKSGAASTYIVDKQYVRKDGRPIWVHLTASMARTPDGQPKYFVSVMEDITERKKEQELLRKSQLRLQSILDHTTACIYMKDLAGRYELINRRFEELFHVTGEFLKGKTDYEIFPQEMAQRLRANDAHVVAAGSPLELEENILQDDGVHTYISIKVPLLDEQGKPVGIFGISTDITQRKRDEIELLHMKNAAEQANMAKTRFLANISHELRTPIMAALSAAEVIRNGDVVGEATKEHGEMILRSGRHLLSLVDDLLDQAQIETGRFDVIRDACCLPDILADVDAVVHPLLAKGVELRNIFATDIPRLIHSDRKRLTQAIVNLVHNAIKFTKVGHIDVKAAIEFVEGSPFLTVRVEDTGSGISHENLNRIFEPFTQLDVGISHPRSGMGLGLALTKFIVQRLGGTLNVQSQPGVGSVFTLRVPVGPISADEWISPENAAQWMTIEKRGNARQTVGLRGSVLLAEDSDDVRCLVRDALRRAGADVTAVADGKQAMEAAKTVQFDLILLDIRMPEMDGLEAASSIRSLGFTGPMIALTASTTRTEQGRIIAGGFDDLWPKPISLEEVVNKAADYLETSSFDERRRKGSTPGLLAGVQSEYARKLPDISRRLCQAVESGDNKETREILHQLVGTSGIVGFPDVSRQAAVAYDRFKAGKLSPASSVLNELCQMLCTVGSQYS